MSKAIKAASSTSSLRVRRRLRRCCWGVNLGVDASPPAPTWEEGSLARMLLLRCRVPDETLEREVGAELIFILIEILVKAVTLVENKIDDSDVIIRKTRKRNRGCESLFRIFLLGPLVKFSSLHLLLRVMLLLSRSMMGARRHHTSHMLTRD